MTEAQILTLITDNITTNNNGEITAVKMKTILDELASSNINLERLKLNLTDNSDSFVPSQKAVKTEIDALISSIATKQNIIPNVQSIVSSASVTPTFDNDLISITAQAEALTINAPTGTAINGKTLLFRIKDDGTDRAITWNAIFIPIGSALPTTTTANKTLYDVAVYDSVSNKWHVFPYYNEI